MDNNLRAIIDAVPCHKHKAETGAACWWINAGGARRGSVVYIGICNKRAIKAGRRGTIHPSSLRKKSPKKS